MHAFQRRLLGALALGAMLVTPGLDAQSLPDGLIVHGYLTQGYGQASDYPIHGVPTSGTGDYRAAAFQTRYTPFGGTAGVVQLSHRRLGESPLMEDEPAVTFDWGFVQQRLGGFEFRAGKVPIPRGLYNEIRYVGVLLPFYRAPTSFYTHGMETVLGGTAAYELEMGAWALDMAAFYGHLPMTLKMTGSQGSEVMDMDIDNTAGFQVFLNTPVAGLRIGSGGFHGKNAESGAASHDITGSVDWSRDRFFARGEIRRASTEGDAIIDANTTTAGYVHGGVRLVGGLWANSQFEWSDRTITAQPGSDLQFSPVRDLAIGATYKFSHKLMLKGEYHDFEGYAVDVPVSPSGPPVENNYFLMSVAVAF